MKFLERCEGCGANDWDYKQEGRIHIFTCRFCHSKRMSEPDQTVGELVHPLPDYSWNGVPYSGTFVKSEFVFPSGMYVVTASGVKL